MCQWLQLPNQEFYVCFACRRFQSTAGFLASEEPIEIMALGDEWWPKRSKLEFNWFIGLVRAVNTNKPTITGLYHSWLGKLMLQELANEQE